jgi:hypothetical protein
LTKICQTQQSRRNQRDTAATLISSHDLEREMMRKTLGVFLLVLLLTGTANAGLIPNEIPAPPPQPATVQEPTNTVQDSTTSDVAGATDSMTQTALDLLALLSSLL